MAWLILSIGVLALAALNLGGVLVEVNRAVDQGGDDVDESAWEEAWED